MSRPARLCAAGVTLRAQLDRKYPGRDKRSDGWIGDAAHQDRESQHNPDEEGVVYATDFDENFGKGTRRNGAAAREFADQLIAYAASNKPGAHRILYVVYENRLASGTYRLKFWKWRPGSWGHTIHIHVSYTRSGRDDGQPFPLACLR